MPWLDALDTTKGGKPPISFRRLRAESPPIMLSRAGLAASSRPSGCCSTQHSTVLDSRTGWRASEHTSRGASKTARMAGDVGVYAAWVCRHSNRSKADLCLLGQLPWRGLVPRHARHQHPWRSRSVRRSHREAQTFVLTSTCAQSLPVSLTRSATSDTSGRFLLTGRVDPASSARARLQPVRKPRSLACTGISLRKGRDHFQRGERGRSGYFGRQRAAGQVSRPKRSVDRRCA